MKRTGTADQALVREINLAIVLHALRERAPVSRASLAAATGLNKTTVSSLVQQLIDLRLVSVIGARRTEEVGRPGILLGLNAAAGCMLGVEIGVDGVAAAATDFGGRTVWHRRVPVGPRHALDDVIPLAKDMVDEALTVAHAQGLRPLGLGLGVPGLVDIATGRLLFAPNLAWRDVSLRELLQPAHDFPIYVDNEANLAALGETWFGAARGVQHLLYIFAGAGLGGGIVVDGRLSLGGTGIGGEVGHMTMEVDGLPCNCGNRGCWETLASQEALFRRIRAALGTGAASTLAPRRHELSVGAVVAAAAEGDALALAALDETGRYLGIGIANLVNALNPQMVVLGGPLSAASAYLLPAIERALHAGALPWARGAMRLVVAEHGVDACLIGGAARVYESILNHPLQAMRLLDQPASRDRANGSVASRRAVGRSKEVRAEHDRTPLARAGMA